MQESPAHQSPDVSRITRSPDSWLVGAFLFLFGVAVAAAMPEIAGAVRNAVADAANSAQGKADTAQRIVVRARFFAVRLVDPKAEPKTGGHEFLSLPKQAVVALPGRALDFPRLEDARARVSQRGYHARAPPQPIA